LPVGSVAGPLAPAPVTVAQEAVWAPPAAGVNEAVELALVAAELLVLLELLLPHAASASVVDRVSRAITTLRTLSPLLGGGGRRERARAP